jgi:hypothetical protein
LTIHDAYRLSELEEVLGDLHCIKMTEIGLIAVIGKVSVQLPYELEGKLQGLVGRRVGVLKLEGYHVRYLDREKHA